MTASERSAPAVGDPTQLVDYAKSLDCIHCGLCLQTCPTYRLSGVESSSPRGRIHLMRAVGEGRLAPDAGYADELDFCLLCRHCESVCPAGVRFGPMMETARAGASDLRRPATLLGRFARWVGFERVLPSRTLLRLAGSALRFGQATGLLRLLASRLGARGEGMRHLPPVPPLSARRLLPARRPAVGARRGHVVLLEGCVMPELYSRVNRATLRSLTRLGFDVDVLGQPSCCGSLHAHNGELGGARRLVGAILDAWERLAGEETLLVTNSAGCGSHLKECFELFEEGDPLHGRAGAMARRVRDYSEVVGEALPERGLAWPDALPAPLAWDAPCHLCHGQGVRAEPLGILRRIAGEREVALEASESCCGSAGIYSLLRPDDSAHVFAERLDALRRSGAKTLVTANPGCQLQWESGLARAGEGTRVVHLAELVDAALPEEEGERGEPGPT